MAERVASEVRRRQDAGAERACETAPGGRLPGPQACKLGLDSPGGRRGILPPSMHFVHLVIRGHVQGVGFRWFARREAQRLQVSGMVRNRADGAVEVEAEGDRRSLELLVESLRNGPRSACVTAVDVSWSEGSARHRGFEIGHEGP